MKNVSGLFSFIMFSVEDVVFASSSFSVFVLCLGNENAWRVELQTVSPSRTTSVSL